MMHIKGLLVYATLVMLIASNIAATGCSYDITRSSNDYKIFTMKEGVAKFTFEYLDKYELGSVNKNQTGTDVFLHGPYVGEAPDFTGVFISVSKPEAGQIGYRYYLEDLIRIDSGQSEFKILERFPVVIDGKSGEEVSFYYMNYRLNEQLIRGIPPAPFIVRRVMFWHDNLLWWLETRGLESSAESDKADFEHIINTFKILE